MGSSRSSHVVAVTSEIDEDTPYFHVDLPTGSEILTMKEVAGEPTLYVLSTREVTPTKTRRDFILVGNEEPIEIEGGLHYIATVDIRRCTRHLFEIK